MRTAVVALAVLALAGCEVNLNSEGIVSRDTKRFTVTGIPEVELETFDGPIEVHSWDRNEVEVEIEKQAMEQSLVDDMVVTAEQVGDRIVVKVSHPGRREGFEGVQIGVHFSPSAKLRVALPRQSHVTVTSHDGSVGIEDVSGTLRLTTSDGSIRGSRLAGNVVARTADGSIAIDRAEGEFDVETDDGRITLDGKLTALRARTFDGSIRLEVSPDSVMAQDWDVQTGDGSVTIALPGRFDAVIDAETRDGLVRSGVGEPDEAGASRRDERDRRTLRTTMGAGGRTLRIRTGDGSIRIE